MDRVGVVGLGYVGLPLVAEAAQAGLQVVGLDLSSEVVDLLNSGRSHVDDLSDADIARLIALGFKATIDPSVLSECSTIIVCVPTPLRGDGLPDLEPVRSASSTIARHLAPGALVVLESTTYPGTTNEVVRPILEAESGLKVGGDLFLGFSPERIDPGNEKFGLRNTPKIVGGETPACLERASRFYKQIVDEVVCARGTREAEAAKLLENTYRHINIALVNEMAKFFHELGVDFWDVIALAKTKPFGFQSFSPGPGVGGHCIPIDPNYLSYRVRSQLGYSFRFVELAQDINASMPAYVVSRSQDQLNAAGLALKGSTVLLLGVTYKPDIADQRESPATEIASCFLKAGATVRYHDPYVGRWDVPGVEAVQNPLEAAHEADLVVLLQNHSSYNVDMLARASARFFDTRGVVDPSLGERL